MPQVKSEGIVLRSVDWKEQSRIVTLFTNNAGKQAVIDRGGRSLKSRRGRLTTFSRMEINYFKSTQSGMGYIGEIEPLEIFNFEKEGTLGRLAFGSVALELLNDLLPEDDPQEDLYFLTVDYFRLIDNCGKTAIIPIFIAYFLKLLSCLGYRPNFAGCISCAADVSKISLINSSERKYYNFSPDRGGLVCPSCQIPGEYYIRLSSERLAEIYHLQTASLGEAARYKIRLGDAEEITEILKAFLKFQTDSRELNSLKFLEKLKKTKL